MSRLLMLMDTPVLEISDKGTCYCLRPELLPLGLRRNVVRIDDFYEWLFDRAMPAARANYLALLDCLKLPRNPVRFIFSSYAVSMTDCYWIKDSNDLTNWSSIFALQSNFPKEIARAALYGETASPIREYITPELTSCGSSAKCWAKKGKLIYLYKVGKNEVAASTILDALHLRHLTYAEADLPEELLPTSEEQETLRMTGESIVQCRLLTDPGRSLVTFEDFAVFASRQGYKAYELLPVINQQAYDEMQIADFVLNNPDRHPRNWGLYMDNDTGKITDFYPLMDHNQAFSLKADLPSRTSPSPMSLRDCAVWTQKRIHLDMSGIFNMDKPVGLTDIQWRGVLERCRLLDSL